MMAYHIHIEKKKRNEFLRELREHDCVLECDIEVTSNGILVLANIVDDFIKYNINGRRKDSIKVVFDAEFYDRNPVL